MIARLMLAAAIPLLLAACHSAPGTTVATESLPPPASPGPLALTKPINGAGGAPAPALDTFTSTGNGNGPAIAAIPDVTTGLVDGIYFGTIELTRGTPFEAVPTDAQPAQLAAVAAKPLACPPSTYGNLEVGDRTVDLAYAPGLIFVAPVPPDGKLHAVAGSYVMDGTLIRGILNATIKGPACDAVLAMHRVAYF